MSLLEQPPTHPAVEGSQMPGRTPAAEVDPPSRSVHERALRVFVLTNMWPNEAYPSYGVWIESQMRSLAPRRVSLRVHFVNGHKSRRAYLRSAFRMVRLNFEAVRYDVVHAQSGYSGALALLQRRIPVLTSFMGSCDLLGDPGADWRVPVKSRVETAIFRQMSRWFDGTITMSAEMERALPASVRARNSVLPHGVDRSLFRPIPQTGARERLGWSHADPIVLFVGHTENKRFDLAVKAVALARAEYPNLQLKQCAHVPQPEVPLWMNAADVLVVTSNVEGSPNMVKEAMACNLPIVSVDVGDVRDVIEGTRRCRIAERDPQALADALCEVLMDAPQRTDGRSRSEHLALPAIADRLVSIYHTTAEARTSRAVELPRTRRGQVRR